MRGLQRQLTLSHLLVTVVSVLILVVGILGGYAIYLRSDWSARWAGDVAANYADDFAAWSSTEGAGAPIDEFVSLDFSAVSETEGLPPKLEDWLLIISADGEILGGNFPDRYPVGSHVLEDPPPGLNADALDRAARRGIAFANIDNRHIGLAPIWDAGDQPAGWVYFHSGGWDKAYQFQQTAWTVMAVSVGMGIIAIILSGVMGYWLARYFGKRLDAIHAASAAFAAGQLDRRVTLSGGDEIAQLGGQFNAMADIIARQMQELQWLAERNAQWAEEAEEWAKLDERNRLGRELHDAIKQQLFGLNLTLGSIRPMLGSDPDLARQRLDEVMTQTQSIQVELDHIIRQLQPPSLQDVGLAAATEALCRQWAHQTGVDLSFEAREARPLPFTVEQAAYRIVQEALQNVGKHADASSVHVILAFSQDELRVEIDDDGQGFDASTSVVADAAGLRNMAQRAADLQGTCTIESHPGRGTRVTAIIPLEKAL
jgi:signal transduction histidine kinase